MIGPSSAVLRFAAIIVSSLGLGFFVNCSGVSRDPLAETRRPSGASAGHSFDGGGQSAGGSTRESAGGSSAGSEGFAGETPKGQAGGVGGEGGANAGRGRSAGSGGESGGDTEGGAAGVAAGSGQPGGGSGGGGMTGEAGATAEGGAANASGSGNSAGMSNAVPVSLQGLVYWFSADFGITEADGVIPEWLDRSGNQAHARQLLADRRPKLGTFADTELPAVVFDGQGDHFSMAPLGTSFEAGLTFFAVARVTAEGLCMTMLEASNGSEVQEFAFFLHLQAFTYEVGDYTIHGEQGAFAVGEPRLLDVTHTPDRAVSLFLNGLATGAATFDLPVNVTRNQNFLGRSLYRDCTTWSGELAEILLYARPLPTEERVAVRAYLHEKWRCCAGVGASGRPAVSASADGG